MKQFATAIQFLKNIAKINKIAAYRLLRYFCEQLASVVKPVNKKLFGVIDVEFDVAVA